MVEQSIKRAVQSPLVSSNNVTKIDDKVIAELLNIQFASVFSKDDSLSPEIPGERGSDKSNFVFTKTASISYFPISTSKIMWP